jgi:hypothetical protein
MFRWQRRRSNCPLFQPCDQRTGNYHGPTIFHVSDHMRLMIYGGAKGAGRESLGDAGVYDTGSWWGDRDKGGKEPSPSR